MLFEMLPERENHEATRSQSPLSTFSRRDSRGIREGEFVGQVPSMPTRRATDADSADSGTRAKRTRRTDPIAGEAESDARHARPAFSGTRGIPRGGRGRVNSRCPPSPPPLSRWNRRTARETAEGRGEGEAAAGRGARVNSLSI